MPLDFRYHLTSLTAVFAALLIGLLLGIAVKEGPQLSGQVESLRLDFQRSQSLRAVDRSSEQFNERTRMLLIRDRLSGRNVALVCNSLTFKDANVALVKKTLEEAGARVTVVITLRPELLQFKPEQQARIYSRLDLPVGPEDGLETVMRTLGADIGRGSTPIVQAMVREKLIRVEGAYDEPISTVVLLGGATSQQRDVARHIDLPFIAGCQRRGLRVAAVEQFEGEYSAMPVYRRVAPITIDNVDRVAGRIALVLALSEHRYGHYGFKDTADDVAPTVE